MKKYEITKDSFESYGWYEDGLTEQDVIDIYEDKSSHCSQLEESFDTREEAEKAWDAYYKNAPRTSRMQSTRHYIEAEVYRLWESELDDDGDYLWQDILAESVQALEPLEKE